jgi:hypothetical protein
MVYSEVTSKLLSFPELRYRSELDWFWEVPRGFLALIRASLLLYRVVSEMRYVQEFDAKKEHWDELYTDREMKSKQCDF